MTTSDKNKNVNKKEILAWRESSVLQSSWIYHLQIFIGKYKTNHSYTLTLKFFSIYPIDPLLGHYHLLRRHCSKLVH